MNNTHQIVLLRSYRHVLTGAKRPFPDEARGGIIADDMGLGKTLVILSTIVGSTSHASEFASQQIPDSGDPTKSRRHSKATLILAPSTRKW